MLTFIVLIFVSTFSQAQTASVFVDVGAGDFLTSEICTAFTVANVQAEDVDGFFDCSRTTGLDGGPYMFQDPVPTGNIITKIEVILYNDVCATTNTIDIADAMLMVVTEGSCSFDIVECGVQQVSVSESVTAGDLATYNFGGMNEFDVMSDGSDDLVVCFSHAEIIFTYEPEPAIAAVPTMSQWGILILGLFMTIISVVFFKSRVPKSALHVSV